jgi:hypothetical protein
VKQEGKVINIRWVVENPKGIYHGHGVKKKEKLK